MTAGVLKINMMPAVQKMEANFTSTPTGSTKTIHDNRTAEDGRKSERQE